MSIQLKIGNLAITSYKRLAYTPWHAIAEMVDNATQSYFNNKAALDEANSYERPPLTVKIDYDPDNEIMRIEDNAMGMSYRELQKALIVASPPENTTGRSKYGMGLKTSASWIGNLWTIITKKLGETTEHTVTVDVDQVAAGNNDLDHHIRKRLPKSDHYTIIEIRKHNRKFKGQTLGKIERFLASMYREDFRTNTLRLIWRDKELTWQELDDKLLLDREENRYQKTFEFDINEDGETRHVSGWVGVLKDGSRSNAGFSILHSGRVVKGWPDSWRPESLYGQEQGSNNLVNQRLVGEIRLDDFEVSHTKDDILWLGEQEDLVQTKLLEVSQDYKEIANTYRKSKDDRRGPSHIVTSTALNDLQKELNSKEIKDILVTHPMLSRKLIDNLVKSIKEYAFATFQSNFSVKIIDDFIVKVYLDEMPASDLYLTVDAAKKDEVIVIINTAHPHWNELDNVSSVLNYLRHCVYDGIAEWQARKFATDLHPDTIKVLKDRLLRLPLEIERNQDFSTENQGATS